ncbi:MAG: SpoIID/LytB domain-containing protein [Lachnospiraceae bacterium]|nr:SpoIID/LytB domain-containing protein [Lachnospiraceae bacterium]
MKKNFLFLVSMVIIPCIMCFGFSLFSDEIQIGKGGNTLESHYLGKEVLIEMNGLYKSMDVEEFVLGILPGTIPADYDMEALKVQAVLIRTNVLKEMQEKNTKDASDLSYRYLTIEERADIWGEQNYDKYEKRLETAVVKTAGKVIEQENSLIMALYHEVSIGRTASAKEILDEDISYLQSVESSQDVEAKHYMNILPYTWEEFGEILGEGSGPEPALSTGEAATEEQTSPKAEVTEAPVSGAEAETAQTSPEAGATEAPVSGAGAEAVQTPPETGATEDPVSEAQKPVDDVAVAGEKIAVTIEESTENGFVKKLSVDGNIYTGEEAMERFGLSSTNFYVEEIEGGIRFICLGKGNCLGISQYGANYMALNGSSVEDIVKYYYKDVSLVNYKK